MILSTSTSVPIEAVAAVPGIRLWYQLYPFKDRGFTAAMVQRAAAAGAGAIVLTVDTTVEGSVHRRPWGGFQPSPELVYPMHEGRIDVELALDWQLVEWLTGLTGLPLVLKGVLHPDDAREAVARGVRGIVVSNHGGRNLDGAAASIDQLAEVAEVVGASELELYVDSGFRRGGDVLKALALGARAVAVGRPILWGSAAGGALGVEVVLSRMRHELAQDLHLAGVADVQRVPRDLVRRRPR